MSIAIVFSIPVIFFLFSSGIVQASHISAKARTDDTVVDVWNFQNYQPHTKRECTITTTNKTMIDCQDCTNRSYVLLPDSSYSCTKCPYQYTARGHPYCHKLVATDKNGNDQCRNKNNKTQPCTDCPYGGNYISTGPYFQSCSLDDDPRGLCRYTCTKCPRGMVTRGHTECKKLLPKHICVVRDNRNTAIATADDAEGEKEEENDITIPCQKCPNGNYITGGSSYISCKKGGLCQYQCINCPKGLYATGHSKCVMLFDWTIVLLVLLLLLFPCLFVAGRVLFLQSVKRCRTKDSVV